MEFSRIQWTPWNADTETLIWQIHQRPGDGGDTTFSRDLGEGEATARRTVHTRSTFQRVGAKYGLVAENVDHNF